LGILGYLFSVKEWQLLAGQPEYNLPPFYVCQFIWGEGRLYWNMYWHWTVFSSNF